MRPKDSADVSRTLNSLPEPDVNAQLHSQHLIDLIKDEIQAAGGRITFAQYMQSVLYTPGLGYYSGGNTKIGEQGDFITAPHISPVYSRCLARQVSEIIHRLGSTQQQPVDVLEFGAGTGVMAVDLLDELARLDALPSRYLIIEISSELRARQQQTVREKIPQLAGIVQWCDKLPQANSFTGVVLANEVLDAMPVHRFYMDEKDSGEYFVGWHEGRFTWVKDRCSCGAVQQHVDTLRDSVSGQYVSEVNLIAQAWVGEVARCIRSGAMLLVDYGFPSSEYYHPQRAQGTLMCHYRHRFHDDPFVYPGLQDITAHVDFSVVAHAADAAGLHVAGFNTQAMFLLANGLDEMLSEYRRNESQFINAMQQIKLLTLPSEMGELFKVIALTKHLDFTLRGFRTQDLRYKL